MLTCATFEVKKSVKIRLIIMLNIVIPLNHRQKKYKKISLSALV